MAKRSKKKITGIGASSGKAPPGVAGEIAVVKRSPSLGNCDWLWGLLLFVAVMAVYSPVWRAGYIWDDDLILTANPVIVGPLGLKEIWTTSAADICPLTLTTFWLEHALWGLAPQPYHLVSVLLHGACAICLWRVLLGLRVPGAWLGAALWALHPVQVESVAWISEMKNTESGLFFLLSILFFVRWLTAGNPGQSHSIGWNYVLTLIFAALAMASKSSTVIQPVVLCLCAWWMEGRWHWRNLVKVAPIFIMSAAAAAVSMWTQGLNLTLAPDSQWTRSWPERLVAAGDAVWFYLGKLLWPHPVITVYPRWQIDAGQWVSYLPLLAVIVVLVVLWLKRESWSHVWFLVFAYFVASLLPVLGLLDNPIFRYSLVFDHLQYLADIGPLALVAAGIARSADFVMAQRRRLPVTLGAGVLLILGTLSWQRAGVFESEEKLWADTLAINRNSWAAYNELGLALFEKGQIDEAIFHYQKALEIYPNYDLAHNNLAMALAKKGHLDEAIVQLQKAMAINPSFDLPHYNLGAIFLQQGRLDDAIFQLRKALEMNPNYAIARNALGSALLQKGQFDEAVAQFQKALEINQNDDVTAYNNLGNAFSQKGRLDEAIALYQKGFKIQPRSNAKLHYNFGNILTQKGELDQAIAEYQRALAIIPDFFEAHMNLGIALAQSGQVNEAIVQFQAALQLNPQDT